MRKQIALGTALLTLVISLTLVSISAQGEHGSIENFCHNPTSTVVIGTQGNEVAFNTTEVTVDKGECVTIMFVNMQDAEHDMALHFANGTEYFGLHIIGDGTPQMRMVNALMPNEDTEMPYWCTVEDHKDQGMEGKIIVGNGFAEGETGAERAPGFGFVPASLAILSSIVLIYDRRIRK